MVLNRDEPEDSDETFETPMKKRREVVGAEPKRKTRKCLNKDYQYINLRNPPIDLISVMKDFTVEQQNSVKKMGFESILGTTVGNIPHKLGFWLAENYDPDSNTLQIGNKSLLITRQTVNDVYGFPLGNTPINALERTSAYNVVIQEFQNQFSTKGCLIRMSDVLPELVKDVTGGRKFILNFLVSMVTVFLGGTTTGAVNQKFLPDIQTDTDIMDLDWCTYALDCLNSGRKLWDSTKKDAYFTGPLLLLVVLYASSTIFPGDIVERRFPLMNCWTTEKLKKRQAKEMIDGGFGKLKIADGVVLVDNNIDDQVLIHEVEEVFESEDMTGSWNGAKLLRDEAHNKPLELVKQGETPREPLPQIHVANQQMDMNNLQHLTKKGSSQSEKQLNELVTMITNLQKQMEGQASEAKRHEKEREKWFVNIQKQIELQAFEAKCREEEREKAFVTNLQNQMEFLASEAKRQEEERHKLFLTNLQKHMELQASEANCREEEREKLWVTNLQKQLELQGLEVKRQEQEREKYIVSNIQKHMERQEEEREKQAQDREEWMVTHIQKLLEHQAVEAECREEIEKRAEIRAHAIMWNIEKQRYFHEQEQHQLRIAWNQFSSANGLDEFQFPHMSHTSFHPPGVESKYYDPAQGNEIPKEFQSLYSDIYGPRR